MPNFYLAIDDDLFEIDQTYDDTLGSQLHLVHHIAHKTHDVLLFDRLLLILDRFELELENGRSCRKSINRVNVPLVRQKVVFVKKEGPFGGSWQKSFSSVDMG